MRRPVVVDLLWTGALTLAITLPLLVGPGFWLVGDMVFVPHQPPKAAWLGLDGALPRAVPMDAIVSALTQVLPGTWVQRLLLVGGLLAGGLGVGRLLCTFPVAARMAAIALFTWNPWVLERLLIGQWAILLGYLLLPWVAIGARQLRDDPHRAWGTPALALAGAAICSPSSGVTAVAVMGVLGLTGDRRGWWRLAVVAVVANLPWLVPSLTARTTTITADGVFEGFAARAESGLGLLPSLLSLGGIWKTSIVPNGRESEAVVVLAGALSIVGLWGLARAGRDLGETRRWLVLGGGALAVAALPSHPGGASLLETLADPVPGLAMLRDSHRYLAPLGLVLAVGVAGAVTVVAERVRPGREALRSVVALLVVAPLLLLPGLAWGASGEVPRSSYPDAWDDVADAIAAAPGRTVVLPWQGSYRGFAWNDHRALLDPAPRYLPGEVLVDDRVLLDDRVVPGEDPRTAAVAEALDVADPGDRAQALRDLGVRWVLVEGDVPADAVPEADEVYDASDLRLLDLSTGGPVAEPANRPSSGALAAIFIGLCLCGVLILNGIWSTLRRGSNTRHMT